MTTKDILNQMEKSFDEKFPEMWGSNDGREGYDTDIKETVIDFFSSNLRTLLESFGEEIIGKNIRHVTASKGEKDHTGDVDTDEVINALQDDIDAVNDYKNEQRLKVKEIISSIGK